MSFGMTSSLLFTATQGVIWWRPAAANERSHPGGPQLARCV